MHVRHLPAGGLKKCIALVPLGSHQLAQRRRKQVNRVFGQMRVGDVALNTFDAELAAERAAAAVFDHVAKLVDRGGLTHDAVIELFTTRLELVADHQRAVFGRAFFVAGN